VEAPRTQNMAENRGPSIGPWILDASTPKSSDWGSGRCKRNFGWMRESEEREYPLWSLTDERQSSQPKDAQAPEGLR